MCRFYADSAAFASVFTSLASAASAASELLMASANCLSSERAATSHMTTITARIAARYGVEAAREPMLKMSPCWMKDPPDFPSGLPITSTAALPLLFCSASNGMYAISLHGSNSEYLDDLLSTFCAAPTRTAAINGVVPIDAMSGLTWPENKRSPKKVKPVKPSTVGVIVAATPHPNFLKMNRPIIIITKVTLPVAVEKLPMNVE
mmetsp:Transcript_11731/g.35746  ORF Transcript_11731/g.35746 Transcript_11731/m.35746 type:complete len:205 (+) Transcript_11731:170-784(+)